MSESLHVAIAAHDFYPDPGSGGTGRYVYETARRMVERGHEVSVVTRRRGDVPARESVDGIDVYRYDLSVAGESAPTILGQLPSLIRAVRGHARSIAIPEPPDVVSFQGPITATLLDAFLPDAPRITTFHSPWPTEYAIKRRADGTVSTPRRRVNVSLRRWLERWVLARSDGALTLSRYMRRQLRAVHGDANDARVVPGGVDADRFSPDAGDFPIDSDGTAFLTVRRLSERMGHDRLLEAFATVSEHHPDTHLYVAGDGPLRESLERRADDLGVAEQATFLGYVPDEDLPAAYASADAFVLPTQALEGFGLATLEALASGTPAVATPVGGTVEVLDGLSGQLPADPLTTDATAESLAEGMAAWAAIEESKRDEAGGACREYVEHRYTWDHTVDRLLAVYREQVDTDRGADVSAESIRSLVGRHSSR